MMTKTPLELPPGEPSELPEPLQEALAQPTSTSGWSRIRSRNSSAQKARTIFRLRISSVGWRILQKLTDGQMAQTYYHFANSLRNLAREWLSSVADWDDDEHEQPLWSDFKEILKNEYAVQTNERLILEGLASLAMKPNETTNELLTQITRLFRVIKESFFSNHGPITPDLHHGISNQTFRTFKWQYTAMMFNFFKMSFKAARTPELRAVVARQDQEQMTVKKIYMHTTTAQREGKTKPPAAVNEIREDDGNTDAADDENDVEEEEPDQNRTNQVVNHEEVTTPDEEEIQAEEAKVTGMDNSATSARSKDTDKRSVGNVLSYLIF